MKVPVSVGGSRGLDEDGSGVKVLVNMIHDGEVSSKVTTVNKVLTSILSTTALMEYLFSWSLIYCLIINI